MAWVRKEGGNRCVIVGQNRYAEKRTKLGTSEKPGHRIVSLTVPPPVAGISNNKQNWLLRRESLKKSSANFPQVNYAMSV